MSETARFKRTMQQLHQRRPRLKLSIEDYNLFGQKHPCTEFVAPAMGLAAHVASLGMCFYEGNMFPTAYKNQVFIAEHGSWDRSVSTGYHIRLVQVEGNHASNYEVFAEGWLIGRFKWGRPVDALVMPDGALLVSDDYAGAVYRITYQSG
jgi:glucose/arabinose dehydrogenase